MSLALQLLTAHPPIEPALRPWEIESFERCARGVYRVTFACGDERVRGELHVRWYGSHGCAFLNSLHLFDVRADLSVTLELERFCRRHEDELFDKAIDEEAQS